MYTKAQIFNLALGLLLLSRQITNTETDPSNECRVLNTHWAAAWAMALEDMDLDSTSTQYTLALVEEDPNDLWLFAYTYPTSCAFLRRLVSGEKMDNRTTRIPLAVRIHEGAKVIFTNEEDAVAEIIDKSLSPTILNASAGMAVAAKLAMMAAPLITGKGAAKLVKDIEGKYIAFKTEAQETDARENFNFTDERLSSEFVEERTS